eukprot:TRINITY_DN16148_c0_g2_i1.p1 TRINITY_DN16148_c0_g2~~TRINITY_DN16148_c0_g2_i1.p1  ORF type:complete len:451 (-),score=84.04 TRINITY_DN16148_c0_g2_i1:144-1412(-)
MAYLKARTADECHADLKARSEATTHVCLVNKRCPRGHRLKARLTRDEGAFCDACRSQTLPANTRLFGCRACCFDKCMACLWPGLAPTKAAEIASAPQSTSFVAAVTIGAGEQMKVPNEGERATEDKVDSLFMKRVDMAEIRDDEADGEDGYTPCDWPELWQEGDVIGCAMDIDAVGSGQLHWSRNGVWFNLASFDIQAVNFQRSFYPAASLIGDCELRLDTASWAFAPPDQVYECLGRDKSLGCSGVLTRPAPLPFVELLPYDPSEQHEVAALDPILASFAPSGSFVVASARDNTAKVWNVVTGDCIHALHHGSNVHIASFSVDGTCVLTADDSSVKVWCFKTGDCMFELCEQLAVVLSASLSSNGLSVLAEFTGSAPQVWAVESRDRLVTLGKGCATLAMYGSYASYTVGAFARLRRNVEV